MHISTKFKYKLYIFTFITTITVLSSYFIYHAINGERGILAFIRLTHLTNKTNIELENVRAERIVLEHKVNLMRSESLDLDLLDEQARKILGYSDANEIVYIKPNTSAHKFLH
ncbi:Septum formation initiator [Rickettsiales bacterium Ac37b]|nr:Septum formation initiator [Rickettsiales bacterium Ac37b]